MRQGSRAGQGGIRNDLQRVTSQCLETFAVYLMYLSGPHYCRYLSFTIFNAFTLTTRL